MKLSVYVVCVMAVSAQLLMAGPGKGQGLLSKGTLAEKAAMEDKKITVGFTNESLNNALKKIEKLSGYRIAYPSEEVSRYKNITLPKGTRSVAQTLQLMLASTIFNFTYTGNTIILFEKINTTGNIVDESPLVPENKQQAPPLQVKGRVIDNNSGAPVADASVVVKGTKVGVNTNRDGEFTLSYNGITNIVLVVSHVGYAEKEIEVQPGVYATIRLTILDQTLADVEISTGMFKRKKESFTGATATFTGAQLRTIGNRNIIQSLKTLDPSFVVVENNVQGSNPNRLPTIELRGKTSITATELKGQFNQDPNQPLFILDGFPSTLQIINDLDINRVESITILKDAASTAIWGSKAANGVIVVETKKPVPGELRVTYTGDFLVEAPDLTSYNMMNATEKLEFERLAGLYKAPAYLPEMQHEYDALYNQRLAEIKRGVNTYWLSEPVQTGFTNGHSLMISGGSNNGFRFGSGLRYVEQKGAMKGSNRKTWGTNIDLGYRKGKFNITNNLTLTGYTGNESPYGSFSDFANANPYYRKRGEDGAIAKYLDPSSGVSYFYSPPGSYNTPVTEATINPLYNAQFANINQGKNLEIRESINAMVTLSNELLLSGGLQVSQGTTTATRFIAPENTVFDGTPILQKGSYSNSKSELNTYNGNLMLSYARVFNEAHEVNLNVRGDVTSNRSKLLGFEAVGFPYGSTGNPAYANQYNPYGYPLANVALVNSTSGVISGSYAFRSRYLLDANYTKSGSNAFGSKYKYAPSWAIGVGWNLHKEAFLQQVSWINFLKLRANMGLSGNENIGTFSSSSTFSSLTGNNVFGQYLSMTSLGNPNLQWQNTRNKSAGIDITLLNNRVSATLNYYEKDTDPLIVGATGLFPSSVGIQSAYPVNVGRLEYKGWELNLRISPVYKLKERIIWTLGVTGSKTAGKYSGFGNKLESFNKEQLNSNGLVRFYDGYSPDDIWAVVSRGIDPGTGQELFQKKDGSETFYYSSDDIVRVGNTRPRVEGVVSSNFYYKGFSLNINLRYRVAGYVLNSALYNKVENISLQSIKNNQDKRALYERWKTPGEVAEFRGIGIDEYTPISSRFIQKDNHIIGESISVGWELNDRKWLQKLRMQGLRLNLYTNDIFRWESVQTERGIDYPFARNISLGFSASF